MTVISLFDGMSCGQIALNRLGIKYDNYYASEVDKYTIKVTAENYPNTIHIGDVKNISYKYGRLRVDDKQYKIRDKKLLIGGSPCQGFSFAGKMEGAKTECDIEITTLEQYLKLKEEGFKFKGQSYLFWEYVRMLKELQPDYFLLENVMMQKKWEKVISDTLGVQPIMINSALVSAQNRKRLYWTNIKVDGQPQDKGIMLQDIIEDDSLCDRDKSRAIIGSIGRTTEQGYFKKNQGQMVLCNVNPSGRGMNGRVFSVEDDSLCDRDKSFCIDVNYFKGGNLKQYFEKHHRQLVFSKDGLCHVGNADIKGNDSIKRVYHPEGKCPTLTTSQGGHREPKILVIGAMRGRYNKDGKIEQQIEVRKDNKSNTLTTVQKDNLVLIVPENTKKGYTEINPGEGVDLTFLNSKTRRGRRMATKSNYLTACNYDYGMWNGYTWRKLTPLECERLQTVPDNYTNHVSNSQRYKMLGNGWTVDVITHILKGITQ